MKSETRSTRTSQRARQITAEFTKNLLAYSNEDWERSLKALAQSLCSELPVPPAARKHLEIQELLPMYVSDEQLGSDVRAMYPAVFQHLETCPDCLKLHQVLAANAPLANVNPPAKEKRTKTKDPSGSTETAWHKTVSSVPGIQTFTFSPNYLQSLRLPAAPALALRGTGPGPKILLISDSFQHGADLISFDAWLEPSETRSKRDQIRLHITSPKTVRVLGTTLRWNAQARVPTRVKHDLIFQDLEPPRTSSRSANAFALEFKLADKKPG